MQFHLKALKRSGNLLFKIDFLFSKYSNQLLPCIIRIKKPRFLQGPAFGIDHNQESFLPKTIIPAEAINAELNCKIFFDFFSFGLQGL